MSDVTPAGRTAPAEIRPFREPAVWLLTALFLLHGAAYALADPVWQAPDEPQHVATIRYIHQHLRYPDARTAVVQPEITRSLLLAHFYDLQEPSTAWWRGARIPPWPSLDQIHASDRGPLISVDGHPPVYYVVLAPVEAAASHLSFPAEVLVLRLVTLLMAAPAIALFFATIRVLWPAATRLSVAATGFVVLLPQFAHISASVSNDPPLVTLFALVLYLSARVVASGLTLRRAAGIAIAGAAASLTKEHGVLAIGVIAVAVVASGMRGETSVRLAALSVGMPLVAAAAWYGGRLAFGLPVTPTDAFPRPPDPHPISFLRYVRTYAGWQLNASFWGNFGWLSVKLPQRQYAAMRDVLLGSGFVSLVAAAVAVVRRRAARAQVVVGGAVLACIAIIMAVIFLTSWRGYVRDGLPRGLQGRYLFPVVVGIAVMIVSGIFTVTPRRLRGPAATGIIAAMIALAGEALWRVLHAFYAPRGTGIATVLAHLGRFSPVSVAPQVVLGFAAAAAAIAAVVAVVAWRAQSGHPMTSLTPDLVAQGAA